MPGCDSTTSMNLNGLREVVGAGLVALPKKHNSTMQRTRASKKRKPRRSHRLHLQRSNLSVPTLDKRCPCIVYDPAAPAPAAAPQTHIYAFCWIKPTAQNVADNSMHLHRAPFYGPRPLRPPSSSLEKCHEGNLKIHLCFEISLAEPRRFKLANNCGGQRAKNRKKENTSD